jgi:hypothetical protein
MYILREHSNSLLTAIAVRTRGQVNANRFVRENRVKPLRGSHMAYLALGVCVTASISGSVRADTNSFLGRWHWNRAQSSLPPGESEPGDLTTEISRRDNQHLTWSATVLYSDGGSDVETFTAATDGKFRRIGGGTIFALRVADNILKGTFEGPSGQSDSFTCIVSAQQEEMTCKGVLGDGEGRIAHYIDVYDRK